MTIATLPCNDILSLLTSLDTPNAASVASNDFGSFTFMVAASGTIRLIKPVNTVPGPTSMNIVTPIAAMVFTDSSHSTEDGSWRTSDAWMSAAFTICLASALLINGMANPTR